mmetsp:Transcript_11595/g.17619  ORF Transcript_11595/g.17619 Transcript_11595/m.17619 type:complete len:94 (-) Transcript_11595:117-398(-)
MRLQYRNHGIWSTFNVFSFATSLTQQISAAVVASAIALSGPIALTAALMTEEEPSPWPLVITVVDDFKLMSIFIACVSHYIDNVVSLSIDSIR